MSAKTTFAQETDLLMSDTAIVLLPESKKNEKVEANNSVSFRPNPKKAVWFAVVCPGLGQIYNRKYWKLPIIYGAFTGLIYGINWNNQYYEDYKQAYSDYVDQEESTDSWKKMLPLGTDPATLNSSAFTSTLIRKKDIYRRNRDLCIIGVVGVYVLTIVDAFVDAQLFEFDISPNLSLRVEPQVQTIGYNNAAVGLQCQLHF